MIEPTRITYRVKIKTIAINSHEHGQDHGHEWVFTNRWHKWSVVLRYFCTSRFSKMGGIV